VITVLKRERKRFAHVQAVVSPDRRFVPSHGVAVFSQIAKCRVQFTGLETKRLDQRQFDRGALTARQATPTGSTVQDPGRPPIATFKSWTVPYTVRVPRGGTVSWAALSA